MDPRTSTSTFKSSTVRDSSSSFKNLSLLDSASSLKTSSTLRPDTSSSSRPPTYTSAESPPPSFVTASTTSTGRLRLAISVTTSIARSSSPAPTSAGGAAGFLEPGQEDPDATTRTDVSGGGARGAERAPLYQLSAPLASHPQSLTLSAYHTPQALKPQNLYAESSAGKTPRTAALYTIIPLPTALKGQNQVNKVTIRPSERDGNVLGLRGTGLVSLGLSLRGFTAKVEFGGKEALVFKAGRWKVDGRVVAESEALKGLGAKRMAELEFVEDVEEAVRDLVVAAWVAVAWMRVMVPKLGGGRATGQV
ncbi:hypothetical protein W97_08917 [Coniosporium apollinis CBS 100218]|uniref:Uncharacterized protein n=1 Tax=Coniosporium apollinis (strain CBS 100218) TaxID=1168221 RepID=R7Z662_CONA1|nr:uncharacterized protein W97_08917 [Coniosporium apollinis CBS 100218]EON69665.1 hypothetical protein W97_08917 [Coniosporium apollinis CBS 100218]